MTDRVSKIILRGDISDLQAKMVAAGKSVSAFGDKITSQDKKSQAWRKGLTSVGDAAGKMGLVAAAGLGAMALASANFDSAMSKVQAATHESAGNMELLRAAAIKAGADTAFSATEAADAITAMSKAGVSSKDILAGGLNGALSLASAGELDVAQSAEIAATAMTQFGLSGKDIPHIADLLAAGAGKAQGEVTDMAQALKYVGPVAHQMGISIEETTGAIAELASQGILGDQAGTSLRGMLSSLSSPSKQAAKEMEALGIQLYDAQGQFVGFNGVAEELHRTMSGLTNAERDQALGRLFGNEQITAARILYAGGAADVDKWTKGVNDANYAVDTAAIKMDNLAGDFEKLKGSLSTLLIEGGDGTQGFLRGVTQGADEAVNALNALPAPVRGAAVGLTAITAVLGGGLWFTAKTINGITEMRATMEALSLTSGRTATAMTLAGRAAGFAAGALAAVAAADILQGGGLDKSLPTINELTNKLNGLGSAAGTTLPKQFNDLGDAIDRVANPNKAQAFQDSIAGVIGFGGGDEVKNFRAQIDLLDQSLAGIAGSQGADAAKAALAQVAKATGLSKGEMSDLLSLLPAYRDALAGAKGEVDGAGSATDGLAGATDGLTTSTGASTTATEDNTKATVDAIKARRQLADDTLAAFDAETAYQRALSEGADREKAAADIRQRIKDAQSSGASERADLQGQLAGTKDPKQRAAIQDRISQSFKDQAKAVADLQNQLGEYAHTLDKTTKAGQANRDVLSHMASAWNNLGENEKNAKGAYADAREALIKQAQQFGLTRKQAERYINRLKLDIPPRVTTQIELDKEKAEKDLAAWLADIAAHGFRTPKQKARDNRAANLLGLPGHADGGYISGPGSGTSDSIPAYLSNGEFVIRAAAVDRYGVDFLHTLNRMKFAQGGYVDQRAQRAQTRGYAAGGYVTSGGPSIDYDRLSAAMLSARPLYGHQTVMPHNYSEFRRQQDADQRAAEMGAVTFRAS